MSAPQFFYDLGSPFSYLSAARIDDVFEREVEWVPILLGAVFVATGRSSWSLTDERAGGIEEVERRAAERGMPPFDWPSDWPNNGLHAMRAAVFAHSEDLGRQFALEAFAEQFNNGNALSHDPSIASAATRAGLSPARTLAATADPEIKQILRENTDTALEMGVVGVPSIVVGMTVFWGDDRLEEAASAAH
ncbi:MAG TPA: DsbA family protein [Solirubrobacterales bacterium]|jgi:2-hydroxychromene-2-carboxylate isomerase|nr:DsbA family protein [Solirubrobacterales bacterium]